MSRQERLEASLELDRMSAAQIVAVIGAADRSVAEAVASAHGAIAAAIEACAARLAEGGRLIYVGAGTSGRLAMLDAAELGPTYGTAPEQVAVLMAGGREAFFAAVEGAEDDAAAGRRELEALGAGPRDVVIGVAASGTTPYTRAALERAGELGCLTVAVTCVAGSPLASLATHALVVETGPEVVMGSTRMKAGTAQKMVLNMLSTGVMVRLGRVYSNLMVEMPATNAKLRRRAVRMVELAAGVDQARASATLERCGGELKTAIVVAALGVEPEVARARLAQAGGRLREVLEA